MQGNKPFLVIVFRKSLFPAGAMILLFAITILCISGILLPGA
jgi:hypothetical protein